MSFSFSKSPANLDTLFGKIARELPFICLFSIRNLVIWLKLLISSGIFHPESGSDIEFTCFMMNLELFHRIFSVHFGV